MFKMRSVLTKIEWRKASTTNGIAIEMLLDYFGIEKITEIIHDIYDSSEIPEGLSRFISLKPGVNEYELHRTISFMIHINKLIIQILMNGTRYSVRLEIRQEQSDFSHSLDQ